jgi:hypothetical protein
MLPLKKPRHRSKQYTEKGKDNPGQDSQSSNDIQGTTQAMTERKAPGNCRNTRDYHHQVQKHRLFL